MKTVAKNSKNVDKKKTSFVQTSTEIATAKTKTFSPTSLKIIMYSLYKLQYSFDLKKYENLNLLNKKNWNINSVDNFWDDFTCSFSTKEFCEALGIKDGGKQRALIEAAIDKAYAEQIKLKTGEHTKWYHWFEEAMYYHPASSSLESEIGESPDKSITLTFNPGVLSMALDHKGKYAYIDLLSYGKLKSIYSLKWYQIIKSYYNMKSHWGNSKGQWKTGEMTIPELKETFGINMNLYLDRTNNLIQKVVKNPIAEINEAHFNFTVEPQFKRGKNNRVEKIWLLCTEKVEPRLLPKEASSDEKEENRQQEALDLEIWEMEHAYPKEWAEVMESVKVESPFPLFDEYTKAQTLSIMKEKGFFINTNKEAD